MLNWKQETSNKLTNEQSCWFDTIHIRLCCFRDNNNKIVTTMDIQDRDLWHVKFNLPIDEVKSRVFTDIQRFLEERSKRYLLIQHEARKQEKEQG
jgi:hypothetical protein